MSAPSKVLLISTAGITCSIRPRAAATARSTPATVSWSDSARTSRPPATARSRLLPATRCRRRRSNGRGGRVSPAGCRAAATRRSPRSAPCRRSSEESRPGPPTPSPRRTPPSSRPPYAPGSRPPVAAIPPPGTPACPPTRAPPRAVPPPTESGTGRGRAESPPTRPTPGATSDRALPSKTTRSGVTTFSRIDFRAAAMRSASPRPAPVLAPRRLGHASDLRPHLAGGLDHLLDPALHVERLLGQMSNSPAATRSNDSIVSSSRT